MHVVDADFRHPCLLDNAVENPTDVPLDDKRIFLVGEDQTTVNVSTCQPEPLTVLGQGGHGPPARV